jgi:hypothetical protein
MLYGPHICGDTIDLKGDIVLTGSYSNRDVLQLWSLSKQSLITNIHWNGIEAETFEYGYLYAAMFEKGTSSKYVAAGGAGKNETHIFDSKRGYKLVGKITVDNTVTSIDFSQEKKTIAIGCGNGLTYSFSYLA